MSDLRVGESVLTIDASGQYEFSPIILFLDRDPEESRQFYVIKTESGHSLTLTPSHLIYAKFGDEPGDDMADFEAVFAGDVREGDMVLVMDGGESALIPSRAVEIETKVQTGVYAPLTAKGNIVVDNVLASCYAQIDSQETAHASLAPMRLLWSINMLDSDANTNGIHWFADNLYSVAEYLIPNRLWSSRSP